MTKKIMLIAGEASGDLHGGKLIAALRAHSPDLEFFGIGGDRMAAAGMELYYHVNDLAYIGFVEVARHYPFFRRVFNHLIRVVRERQPDVVVLIDYPGFNLRFARAAKKFGHRTFYYIAPQVWAWGQGRAAKMAAFIDQMAVIFEFEVPFFSRYHIKTTFVGHPLLEGMNVALNRDDFFHRYRLDPSLPLLALVPGSRNQEVTGLLPPLLETAARLRRAHPGLQVAMSQAVSVDPLLFAQVHETCPWVKLVREDYYGLLRYASAGIVASGTATLEAACSGLPFALVYKVSPLSFAIGRRLVKIPYIGLVNIVAGAEVAPEFLQKEVAADRLVPAMEPLLFDETIRTAMRARLEKVRATLGRPGASAAAAALLLEQLNLPHIETKAIL